MRSIISLGFARVPELTELDGFTRLTELTELEGSAGLSLFGGELDVELLGISLELDMSLIIDGGRELLITAFRVCEAGNLIILIADGENPIDDLSSGVVNGEAASASRQFNNAFASR